mmetsp:Transcript_40374/g.48945  ORF Transcript_40374/g.48945 Transcript_40374/m.48945 type:complete len:375 (+) Transcript_40374:275-1399(+)|eukprot:CAMPEP_0197856712 /NCGR_PEP_ID=MMETSP1438-20131217/29096_1 /TAXON_ID=1461541 /ORGANISM="Pterosperma sp., Strain CCMP1384" /LENGTH=374 /DNA_ID=CAMNT_0043472267 /DNA_START=258 /DNA_END=1382 /DNA_ORIENTATION=-
MAEAEREPILEPASADVQDVPQEAPTEAPVAPAEQSNGEAPATRSADELTAQYLKLRASGKLNLPKRAPASHDAQTIKHGRRANSSAFKGAPKVQETYKQRVYSPGPGAYEPTCSRNGSLKRETYSFGGSDRSYIGHVISQSHSPGPRYIPNTSTSKVAYPSYSFGRATKDPVPHHNSPYGNPGPGAYPIKGDRKGDTNYESCPGMVFGSASHINPHQSFAKTVFISSKHEYENHGIHSPGPQYNPGDSAQVSHVKYSMRPKLTMSFDKSVVSSVASPGPGKYLPKKLRDGETLGHERTAPFDKSIQRQRPEDNISSTVYISEVHSLSENVGITSPGPCKYTPVAPSLNVTTPNMRYQGHGDRFFSPFETGRLH